MRNRSRRNYLQRWKDVRCGDGTRIVSVFSTEDLRSTKTIKI